MTEYLIAARAAVILWTNLAVMPTEILFDAIEAVEASRRRAMKALSAAIRCASCLELHCYPNKTVADA